MKNIYLKIILIVNTLIWIFMSAVNYVGIMQQLNEDIMSIFIWSIFTVMMYGLIVYSISLTIARFYFIYYYRDSKVKYLNITAFVKQIILLAGAIFYLYGVCYYNANLLGLLPMFLFFGKKLIQTGKFYVQENDTLLMIDDVAKEYIVKEVNDGRISIQGINMRSLDIIQLQYKMQVKERIFLSDVLQKELMAKEVA